MKTWFENTFFLPSWLAKCLEPSVESKQMPPLASCIFWSPSKLKALSHVLNLFQRRLLENPACQPFFSLNLESTRKEFNIHPAKLETLSNEFFSQLGGLRFYLEKGEKLEAISLFKEEGRNQEDIFLKTDDLGCELILGITSSYHKWLRFLASYEKKPSEPKGAFPLEVKKSLWLELNDRECSIFLSLEQKAQKDRNLVSIAGDYKANLLDLINKEKSLTNKNFSLSKSFERVNSVIKKASYHGSANPFSQNEILWMEQNSSSICGVWQKKQNNSLSQLPSYKKLVSAYFVKKVIKEATLFFNLLGEGLGATPLKTAKEFFSQKIGTKIEEYSSDFFMDEKGSLSPLILLFMEFYLRLHPNHKNPIPSELKGYFPQKASFPFELLDNYKNFVSLFQKEKSLKESVLKNSLFLSSQKNLCLKEKYHAYAEKTWSPFPIKKAENKKVKEEKFSLPQKKEAEKTNLEGLGYSDSEVKLMIDKDLTGVRSHSLHEYQKLKKLYYNSLNEKSQNIILTLEKRMKQDLFDHQIQQRLVDFIFNNPQNPAIKSVGAIRERIKNLETGF